MTVSNSSQNFRGLLRLAILIILLSLGIAALSSCTVTYTHPRPVPPPDEPEVVYVQEEPNPHLDAFPVLEPYGHWVYVHEAGWAWHPDVDTAWRPYYYGHWSWSDYGWTWVSYEPYGWAVYHYGNWSMDPRFGWVWFPNYEWQANCVTWVVYQDYIAWAPSPYRGYSVGDPWMSRYDYAWNVCHVMNFTHHFVGDYRVRDFRPKVHKNPHYVMTRAPEVTYIYQRPGSQVARVHIKTVPARGNKYGLKQLDLPPQERARIKGYETRANQELYGKGNHGKPTPITPPDIDTEVAKEKKDGPTPMTRPDPRAKGKKQGGLTPMTRPDPRTAKDSKGGPTPMTKPDVNNKSANDGPTIITESENSRKQKRTYRGRPARQDPGSRDNKANPETKPNRQDPGRKHNPADNPKVKPEAKGQPNDKDAKGKDAKDKDAKGDDAKDKDVKGKDAKDKDVKGKDAKGKDAKGDDAKGKDAKDKDVKGKDAKGDDAKSGDDNAKNDDDKGKGKDKGKGQK